MEDQQTRCAFTQSGAPAVLRPPCNRVGTDQVDQDLWFTLSTRAKVFLLCQLNAGGLVFYLLIRTNAIASFIDAWRNIPGLPHNLEVHRFLNRAEGIEVLQFHLHVPRKKPEQTQHVCDRAYVTFRQTHARKRAAFPSQRVNADIYLEACKTSSQYDMCL